MRVATTRALNVSDSRACVAQFGYEPRTTGVPLLPPDAHRDTWLTRRKSMVTASEVAAVFGRSTYDSPFSLWWRKQPDWPADEGNLATRIGSKLEPVIGELWEEGHPEARLFRSGAALWGHYRHEWLGATPDYLAVFPEYREQVPVPEAELFDPIAWAAEEVNSGHVTGVHIEPVECKSDEGGDGWGRAGTDEVPFHHLCQVLTQCLVMGADRGRIVRLSGKRLTEYVIDVDNHTALCGEIISAGQSFVVSIEAGIVPPLDGHPSTEDALKLLHTNVNKGVEAIIPDDLADAFDEACDRLAEWKAREAELRNQIRDLLGRSSAQYGVRPDGRRVASRIVYKRNGYTVGPTEVDSIRKSKSEG